MAEYYFQKKRRNSPKKTICLFCTIVTQCTAELYNDWSLQMGSKMTLCTLTMSGDDFPGILGAHRDSNSVQDLIRNIYRR